MKKNYLFLICIICSINLFAQWSGDPVNGGTPVCIAPTSEQSKISVSDGANGAIIVFQSYDNNTNTDDFYVQRINSLGMVSWGNNITPKPVCVNATEKELVNAIPDGNGGVFIAWVDYRRALSGDIYMQHISNSGNPLWAINGIRVNSVGSRELFTANLCLDGSTGVIVCWDESINDPNSDFISYSQVFAQKFNANGTAQWTAGGIQICTASGFRGGGNITADGSNGAIICFGDTRNSNQTPTGDFNNIDIYAQRLNSSGALLWTGNGVAINTQPFNQFPSNSFVQSYNPVIPDGAGGVIMLFDDYTGDNDGNNNLYAQRLNANGARQWAAAGVPVCTADSSQYLIKNVSDGAGGMVVFFNDDREGILNSSALYAQRILNNGTASWAVNGVKIIADAGYFGGNSNGMTEDGAGNYIFCWTDPVTYFLKAQKINNSGTIQWAAGGKDVCSNPEAYPYLGQLIKSNAGSTIISWVDGRNPTTTFDIYAAKISDAGNLVAGGVSTSFITTANGNWNAPATWVGGVVPPATAIVTIRHTVTVTTNASCKALKVEKPTGSITVNTGINLTVQQ